MRPLLRPLPGAQPDGLPELRVFSLRKVDPQDASSWYSFWQTLVLWVTALEESLVGSSGNWVCVGELLG